MYNIKMRQSRFQMALNNFAISNMDNIKTRASHFQIALLNTWVTRINARSIHFCTEYLGNVFGASVFSYTSFRGNRWNSVFFWKIRYLLRSSPNTSETHLLRQKGSPTIVVVLVVLCPCFLALPMHPDDRAIYEFMYRESSLYFPTNSKTFIENSDS